MPLTRTEFENASRYITSIAKFYTHGDPDLMSKLQRADFNGSMSMQLVLSPQGQYSFVGTSHLAGGKSVSVDFSESEIKQFSQKQVASEQEAKQDNQRKAEEKMRQDAVEQALAREHARKIADQRAKDIAAGKLPVDVINAAINAIQGSSKDQIPGFDMKPYSYQWSPGRVTIRDDEEGGHSVNVSGFKSTSFTLTKQEVEDLSKNIFPTRQVLPPLQSDAPNKAIQRPAIVGAGAYRQSTTPETQNKENVSKFINLDNLVTFEERPGKLYVRFDTKEAAEQAMAKMEKSQEFKGCSRMSGNSDTATPNARWIEITGAAKTAAEEILQQSRAKENVSEFINLDNLDTFTERPGKLYVRFDTQDAAEQAMAKMEQSQEFKGCSRMSGSSNIFTPNARWIEITGAAKTAVEEILQQSRTSDEKPSRGLR